MEDDKKAFDKAKYLKTVRAKEQQLNFKRNFESEGDDITRNAQLNSKYRDRAQERKVGQIDANDDSDGEYGYLENDDDDGKGLLEENEEHIKKHGLAFADEKDQFQLSENVVRLKGLDYSLLNKELQKTKEVVKIEKAAAAKTIASIKESLSNAQKKKEPSEFAKKIMRVLDQNSSNHGQSRQSKRVPFPIPCSYYEYEIPSTSVLSELPSVVLKEKSIDEQTYVIPVVGSEALDSLSRIITIYSLKGKKGLKEERERLQKLQEEQQKQAMDVEDDQDIFEDADESIFEKNQKESNQILAEEKEKKQQTNKEDDQDILEDINSYKQALIEEQKREFLRQKADNILNSRNSEHQKMGGRVGMNDKRSNPFEEKVEYDECFPKMAPNILQMKEMREREKLFTVAEPYKKNKKEIFGRKLAAVERVIKEKQDIAKKSS